MSFTLLEAHVPDVQIEPESTLVAQSPAFVDTVADATPVELSEAASPQTIPNEADNENNDNNDDDEDEEDWDEVSKGRYFADTTSAEQNAPVCHNCKAPGHKRKDCPHRLCRSCGALDDHDTIRCPMTQKCYNCSRIGHVATKCPEPPRQQGSYCRDCGSRSHLDRSCPQIWRLYLPSPSFKPDGDWDITAWCYNCAAKGHYGDDCPKPHRSRLIEQSAFCMANQPESRRSKRERQDIERAENYRRKREVAQDIKEDWFLRQQAERRDRRYDPYARPKSNPIITSERFPRGLPSARGRVDRSARSVNNLRGRRGR